MSDPRRFPIPWSAVELQEAFRIEDASGFPVAYVYFTDNEQRRTAAQRMSRDEARRLAEAFVLLPELREQLLEAKAKPRTGASPEPGAAAAEPSPGQ